MTTKIAAICGSLRNDSFNRKLLALAVTALEGKGAAVDVIDLKKLVLPIYDGDVETAAYPAAATELRERIAATQGVLVVTPEYNHSVPGGLKNAIDWASRPSATQPFKNKVVALMGCTMGPGMVIRSHLTLRQIFAPLSALVLPGTLGIPTAQNAFDPAGQLKDARLVPVMTDLLDQLLALSSHNPLAAPKG